MLYVLVFSPALPPIWIQQHSPTPEWRSRRCFCCDDCQSVPQGGPKSYPLPTQLL